jgi:hypothetical protein
MDARRVRLVAIATSTLFVPIYFAASRLIWGSRFLGVSFVVVLYASVLAALLSTLTCYRSDQRSSLAPWRRTPHITGLTVLLALCLLPLATWPIMFSGVILHLRIAVFCLLGVNAAAAILVWFGSGWSRVGLTVVAYWICFLWVFPLALRQ